MISLVIVIVAGFLNAIMDKLQFHFATSVFADKNPLFWNPAESWKNKWKNGDKAQGEKFILSSTVLVSFTDAWHLFKSLYLTALVAAVIMYQPMINPLVDFLIIKIAMSGTFELSYSKLLTRS